MALVAAKSVKLKPETVLVQALHDYGLVLTDEQKARLRPQTGDRAPDPSAVIALTVSIDEENCNRRSRCVGNQSNNSRVSSTLWSAPTRSLQP